jgi:hypothetical protein
MTHHSAVPVSPAFESLARGAPFRDRIAIIVRGSPETILQAIHDVALRDMKLAWALGEIRYLPSRLGAHARGRVDAAVPVIAHRGRHAHPAR